MKRSIKFIAPLAAALLTFASSAQAQICVAADVGSNCQLTSTSQTADITLSNLGVPVGPLQVRYVGGLAGATSKLYFFNGAFNALDLSNATLLGSKSSASVVYGSLGADEGWITLPGSYGASSNLLFGLNVDFAWGNGWLLSGYDANGSSWSRIFASGTGPAGDPNADNGNKRWTSPWAQAYNGGLFIGFEDNPLVGSDYGNAQSDLDYNDAVLQVRLSTVPEPSTYALMGAGLLALGVAARRRRTTK